MFSKWVHPGRLENKRTAAGKAVELLKHSMIADAAGFAGAG
ncbi:hypothetical protein [Niabella sp.]|nr:hypothetical protein [Niabella sp.]